LVDKVLPQLAWLAPEFEEACSKDKFVQADASRERSRSRLASAWTNLSLEHASSNSGANQANCGRTLSFPRIFDRANGEQFDYVINCGGESRHSQPDDVYDGWE
jgi:hypothetical protein